MKRLRVCLLGALLLPACWLERATGEVVPLDPRFYEAVERSQGDPDAGGGAADPFGTYEGARVVVRGVVVSEVPDPVDIDVRTPDPASPGGVAGHGKLMLDGPGVFELEVPSGFGVLELQGFQDPGQDGPGGDDSFATVTVEVGVTDVEGVVLSLVAGGRDQGGLGGSVHQEMPPGAPGGAPAGPGAPGGGIAGNDQPFPTYDGVRVRISGSLSWEGQGVVDLDLFQPDAYSPGGRKIIAKLKRSPGAYAFEMPVAFGPLMVEALVDVAGDGPGPGDPMGVYAGNPVEVGSEDVEGVDVVLAFTADGKLPGVPPAGVPPAGVPPTGVPPAGVPPAGVPPAGVPPAGVPPTGVPPAGGR